ncbi:MAG: RNA polymerase sigma factor [Paraprevotella sp.]|nr:RNA polymerase sigma factor [Paraprevotella sp.]
MTPEQEYKLIVRIRSGHPEDFSCFLDCYGARIMTLISRMVSLPEDVEELVQDTFVQAYLHLDSFGGQSRFSTWIYRIAYNQTVSWLRRNRRITVEWKDDYLEPDELVDEMMQEEEEENIAYLEQAIEQLNPDEKALIVLHYHEEHSVQEMAYILQMSAGTVATRLCRLRKKLYRVIKQIKRDEAR